MCGKEIYFLASNSLIEEYQAVTLHESFEHYVQSPGKFNGRLHKRESHSGTFPYLFDKRNTGRMLQSVSGNCRFFTQRRDASGAHIIAATIRRSHLNVNI